MEFEIQSMKSMTKKTQIVPHEYYCLCKNKRAVSIASFYKNKETVNNAFKWLKTFIF
jgi:hypothetical protein